MSAFRETGSAVEGDHDRELVTSAARSRIGLLVDGEYAIVEAMVRGSLTAEELRTAVSSLPGELVDPPAWEWVSLSIVPVDRGFEVVIPLWTDLGPSAVGMRFHADGSAQRGFWIDEAEFVPVEPRSLASEAATEVGVCAQPARAPRAISDTPVPERWRAALGELIHRLVIGDYAGLESQGLAEGSGDGLEHGIGHWIEAYPDRLVDPPPDWWKYSEHSIWEGRSEEWWVIVPLWTERESPSDLSLEATVWDDGAEIRVRIDTAPHVM